MRIGIGAQLLREFPSGVELYIAELIEYLLRNGPEHTFYLYGQKADIFARFRKYQNAVFRPVTLTDTKIERVLWEQLRLAGALRRDRVELFHSPAYILPYRKLPIPTVLTLHDLFALTRPELCRWHNRCYYRDFLPQSLKNAGRVITLTNTTHKEVIQRFPALTDKSVTLYPGIPEAEQATDDAGISPAPPYILYVGNIEPKKNLPLLLKAFAVYRAKGGAHRLIIVGRKSWAYKTIARLASQYSCCDAIEFTGYLSAPQKWRHYRKADLFVFPSLCEGLGFPPLEAASCGTPVLLPDLPVFRETLPQAVFFAPNDAEDCAQALLTLTSSPKRRDYDLTKFDFDAHARQCLALYRELLHA